MCKFRPGSGNFLDLPGKTKENKRKPPKLQELQGLNFGTVSLFPQCFRKCPGKFQGNALYTLVAE